MPDRELAEMVDDAGAEVEADPAVRAVDRLHAEHVQAVLTEHDPAVDDLEVRDTLVWPNGEVSSIRAGFIDRL